jgi:hypothetical protein
MRGSVARRMGRLEREVPAPYDFESWAFDDRSLHILDTTPGLLAGGFPEQYHAEFQDGYEQVKAGIRHQARLRNHPAYAEALAALHAEVPGFVPAVAGMGRAVDGSIEVMGLDHPGLFKRRTAYLARPSVRELIEDGSRHPVELAHHNRDTVGSAIIGGLWRTTARARR